MTTWGGQPLKHRYDRTWRFRQSYDPIPPIVITDTSYRRFITALRKAKLNPFATWVVFGSWAVLIAVYGVMRFVVGRGM